MATGLFMAPLLRRAVAAAARPSFSSREPRARSRARRRGADSGGLASRRAGVSGEAARPSRARATRALPASREEARDRGAASASSPDAEPGAEARDAPGAPAPRRGALRSSPAGDVSRGDDPREEARAPSPFASDARASDARVQPRRRARGARLRPSRPPRPRTTHERPRVARRSAGRQRAPWPDATVDPTRTPRTRTRDESPTRSPRRDPHSQPAPLRLPSSRSAPSYRRAPPVCRNDATIARRVGITSANRSLGDEQSSSSAARAARSRRRSFAARKRTLDFARDSRARGSGEWIVSLYFL